MKKLFYILIVCTLSLVSSCSDNEVDYVIPSTPVNFKINLYNVDNHLNSAGNVGVYIPSSKISEYNELLSGVNIAKVYGTPRSGGANEYYGYSGVLIINTGSSSGGNANLLAYDLCCSNEQHIDTRVVPANDLKAKCPKCNSVFDLYSAGRALSGPATTKGKKLQSYRVYPLGVNEFRIVN